MEMKEGGIDGDLLVVVAEDPGLPWVFLIDGILEDEQKLKLLGGEPGEGGMKAWPSWTSGP